MRNERNFVTFSFYSFLTPLHSLLI